MTRRVVVTGIGVISAFGSTREVFLQGLTRGVSAIRPLTLVPHGSLKFAHAAEVPDFRASRHFDEKEAGLLDRFSLFALVAARQAVADSAMEFTRELGSRAAIVTGTSAAGQSSEDEQFRNLYARNQTRIHPLTIPRIMANAAASRISLEYRITGPVYTVSTAC